MSSRHLHEAVMWYPGSESNPYDVDAEYNNKQIPEDEVDS